MGSVICLFACLTHKRQKECRQNQKNVQNKDVEKMFSDPENSSSRFSRLRKEKRKEKRKYIFKLEMYSQKGLIRKEMIHESSCSTKGHYQWCSRCWGSSCSKPHKIAARKWRQKFQLSSIALKEDKKVILLFEEQRSAKYQYLHTEMCSTCFTFLFTDQAGRQRELSNFQWGYSAICQ